MKELETPIEVGIVTIEYNEQGKPIHEGFTLSMQINFNPELLEQLKEVPTSDDSEKVRRNAENIVAQWFTRINDIDLADHFEYGFDSEVVECDKWPSGQVKKCSIKFTFKKFQ